MKYYAVKKGRHPGIYTTWKDCQKEVDHFKDAKFKSFDSKKEVLAYLKQNNQKSSLHSKQETTNQRKQNKDKISLSKDQYKAYHGSLTLHQHPPKSRILKTLVIYSFLSFFIVKSIKIFVVICSIMW